MVPPPHSVLRETVSSAVAALTKWMKKRTTEAAPNLLSDERDDLVILQLSLRRIPASPITKPRLLPLPHPVIGHAGASVCVISDDRPKSRSPSASDLLDASKSLHHLPVSEVIPLSTLRTDYRPYESRRRLAGSHDLFIADRAILPLLPRVLGKAFYSTKKAPIGVNFTRVGWPEQMRKVLDSTFLYLRTGTCSGIKVGRLDMVEEDIVENVIAAVGAAVEEVPKKWANVRALHLKAVDSVALPIYQAVPELRMKIEVPPVAQLEGEDGTAEAIDAPEASKMSNNKKKVLRDADTHDGEGVAKEKSGKRKRNKKRQTEDAVMQEVEPEKKKSKSILIPIDVGQKVGKKGKRALEKEAEASKGSKKSEPALEEVSSTKKKGKKEGTKHELEGDVMNVANIKNKKGKSEEGKKKKSSKSGGNDFVESLEDKKSKGKKMDGNKIKKTRTRVRV